jgi:N-acyl-D-aspartate/D-glutamate deacylase
MSDQHGGRRITRIDELQRDLPPDRDLWPAIAAAIEADKAQKLADAAPASAPRRPRWLPAAGLAAAAALVAIGVLIGQFTATKDQPAPVAAIQQPRGAEVMKAALRDAEYRKQRDALLVEVQAKLQTMPADERAKVAASISTLQKSITEIETALGRDPANALLQELLVSSCQEEMRALTAVRDSGRQEI